MKYKRKQIEVKVAGKNRVITKKYKIDVPQVDNFAQALKEFDGMIGILGALNMLLEGRASGTFRSYMRNFGNVRDAKRAAKNARVRYIRPSVSIKKKLDLYERVSTFDLSNMSPEDIANVVKKVME